MTPVKIKYPALLFIYLIWVRDTATSQILRGFTTTPDPSVTAFQTLLKNPSGDFALGFSRIQQTWLVLTMVHVNDTLAEPIWCANRNNWARWKDSTRLFFNGSLVLSDSKSGFVWSTQTNGYQVVLLDSANLQVLEKDTVNSFLWQSFDYPTDTIVENQNFTVSMTLSSSISATDPSQGLYSMRLNSDNLGLYANFHGKANQIYWKRTAMQVKAVIQPGKGPIYARVNPNGYLGMYQTEAAPIDVLSFPTFQRKMVGFRLMRLEPDGNFRSYFWNDSSWALDYQVIDEPCELPSFCGSYGLCNSGGGCSCLDNRTNYYPDGGCFPAETGDFCEGNRGGFWILRNRGVELPFKELMEFVKVGSLKDCEDLCERNCSCWGAAFGNSSGACYLIDFPVQTLVRVGDEQKFGFFKVRILEKKRGVGLAEIGLLVGACLVLVGAVVGFGVYVMWFKKKKLDGLLGEEGLSPGSYRDLDESSGLELCKRNIFYFDHKVFRSGGEDELSSNARVEWSRGSTITLWNLIYLLLSIVKFPVICNPRSFIYLFLLSSLIYESLWHLSILYGQW